MTSGLDQVAAILRDAPIVYDGRAAASPQSADEARIDMELDDIDDVIDEINQSYALVLVGKTAMIMVEKPDGPVEDRCRMLTQDAFKAYLANKSSLVSRRERSADGTWTQVKKRVSWAPLWLMSPKRRSYIGIEFNPNPDGSAGSFNYYNLWRGFSIVPDAMPAGRERTLKYKTFQDHLFTNVCSGSKEIFDWVFHWFAHIVQRPRERIGTAIVLRGKMGTGKTKVGEYFGALFASHYFLVDDPRYLVGQFNAHMSSCLLLQVDEGFWAGDKAAEGRLKGLVTSSKQMIEAKGVDSVTLNNYVRLLFSSNEDWVVPAGMDERRFAVFDVAPHVAQNHAYFAEMDREMQSGGLEALLADLLSLDLDAAAAPKIRVIPKTDALLEQKIKSLDPVASWWYERLTYSAPTIRRSTWPKQIPIHLMFDDYIRWADKIGVRRRSELTSFGMRLRKLTPTIERVRVMCDEELPDGSTVHRRAWCFNLPPLSECRAAFETALGQQRIDWNSGDPDAGDEPGVPVNEFTDVI